MQFTLELPYYGANYISESGEQLGQRKLNKNKCKYIAECDKGYNDQWNENSYKIIFKTPEGFWGLFTYTPAGWSSYTYDPYNEAIVIESKDFIKFWNMVLTNDDRNDFESLKNFAEATK